MNRKIKKIIVFFVMLCMCITILNNFVYAGTVADIVTEISGYEANDSIVEFSQSLGAVVINVIRIVAVGVAVVMLTVIGIKYMTASAEGKAEYKKTAIGFVVGAVVLFATAGILGYIKTVAEKLTS